MNPTTMPLAEFGGWGADLVVSLASAAIGAVAVLLSRRLRSWRGKIREKRRVARISSAFDSRLFSIGPISTTVFVADFAPMGYLPSHLHSYFVEDEGAATPTHLRTRLQEHQQRWRDAVENHEAFNGRVLALRKASIARDPVHERPGWRLGFAISDYVTQRSVCSLYQELPDAERVRLTAEAADRGPDPVFSTMCGVTAALITSDGKLVFAQRSARVAVNPGRIVCGVAEGMQPTDLTDGAPDPHETALRGYFEEYGIRLSPSDRARVQVTSLILDTDFYEWTFVCLLDLREASEPDHFGSSSVLQSFGAAQAKDKWESARPLFIDLTPEAVTRFVATNDVTNYGIVTAVFALLSCGHEFDAVADAFTRASVAGNRRSFWV